MQITNPRHMHIIVRALGLRAQRLTEERESLPDGGPAVIPIDHELGEIEELRDTFNNEISRIDRRQLNKY